MDATFTAPLSIFSTDEKRERKVAVVSCTVLDLFNCSETPIPESAIAGKISIDAGPVLGRWDICEYTVYFEKKKSGGIEGTKQEIINAAVMDSAGFLNLKIDKCSRPEY